MKNPVIPHIVSLLALASGLCAQIVWNTTVLEDTFQLNGSARVAGGDLWGAVETGDGSWLSGNGTTKFGAGGGIIAHNTTAGQGAGYGSAYSRVSFGSFDLAKQADGYLKLTASVTLGKMSEWVGFGFLKNNGSDWWGGGGVNQLWVRINSVGTIWLAGNNVSNPSFSVSGRSGFTTSGPVEIALLYNVATQGVDIYFNGENVTPGWGLKTNVPISAAAVGFYLNGSQGPNTDGAISTIHSISVKSTCTPVFETTIFANQPVGLINKGLAGVALGGGATTYRKPAFLNSLDGLGVRYVRLETITADSRGLYNAATDTWNWTLLDQEIENIQATGAEIVANIFYTPRFLAYHDDSRYYYSYPKDYDAWARYVAAIVHHVNIEKGYGIKYWEIGNEPSGGHFFRAPMSEFYRYYGVTAQAVKQGDATALVGGLGDNAQYPIYWKNLFSYCLENGVPVDFVSFHWYGQWTSGGDTRPYLSSGYATTLKELALEMLSRDLPVFLTEWNLVGENPDSETAKVGAYLGAGLYWLQESPVDAAFYFRVEPYGNTLGSLLAADSQWRTLGRIFSNFSKVPDCRVNLVSEHSGIVGLAACAVEEEAPIALAAILTRFDPDYTSATVSNKVVIADHGLSGHYRLVVTVEDAGTVDLLGRDAVEPLIDQVLVLDPESPVEFEVSLRNYAVAFLKFEKEVLPNPPVPLEAASLKTHGDAGIFSIPLHLCSGGEEPGKPFPVEYRLGGDVTLAVRFDKPIAWAEAIVIQGEGYVDTPVDIIGESIFISVNGVPNAQVLRVALNGIQAEDGGYLDSVVMSLGILMGDVNGDGIVDMSDVNLARSRAGPLQDPAHASGDINADGIVNMSDINLIRSASGRTLP